MHDQDQRFKTLIQEFFAEFLQLFFAKWAERLDASMVEWLDKEAFLDPPQGDKNVLDLVAKLRTREPVPGYEDENEWLALVNIEIESPDRATPLRPRMNRYYHALRVRYDLPVLPIAVFMKVGMNGIGVNAYEEHFWELRPIRFEYLYVGWPQLNAVEYVEGGNWLGWALASLMKIPKDTAVELGSEALRQIAGSQLSEQKRHLLYEFVQAYWPLSEDQRADLKERLKGEKYIGVQAMNKTTREEGIEEGIEKGEIRGRRAMLREQLKARFGDLSSATQERLEGLALSELKELGKAVVRAQSLAELGFDK